MGEAQRKKLTTRQIDGLIEALGDNCETFEMLITDVDFDPDKPFESAEDKVRMLVLGMAGAEIMRVGAIEAARAGYAVRKHDGSALTIRFPRDRASEVRADVMAGCPE